ncbi:MAG: hypothetical protein MZW92_48165 [Comamonadaceae bacterium]|nr:hypothetical protein [Comamonadaceae bacterium]
MPAVFLGGVISAALMLPLALPLQAGPRDIALLARARVSSSSACRAC